MEGQRKGGEHYLGQEQGIVIPPQVPALGGLEEYPGKEEETEEEHKRPVDGIELPAEVG